MPVSPARPVSFVVSNLHFLMNRRKLNANSLAVKLEGKLPQATIFRVLNGDSTTPRDSTVQALAAFFGVSLTDMRYVDLSKEARGISSTYTLTGASASKGTQRPEQPDTLLIRVSRAEAFALALDMLRQLQATDDEPPAAPYEIPLVGKLTRL